LTWAQVLVLKLELRVRQRSCLLPHAFRDAHALGFRLERWTRGQRAVHRLAQAQRLLRSGRRRRHAYHQQRAAHRARTRTQHKTPLGLCFEDEERLSRL